MININEIRITKINKGNMLAYASIMIDNCFIIEGIELREGEKGKYILMPLDAKRKKAKRNSAYPITDEAREKILNSIVEEYAKE